MTKNKETKKISKRVKQRLFSMGTLSIVLFVIFCFNVASYSYKIITLTNEEKELSTKLDDLKTEREELLVEIEKLQDPDYLARYARETYYYTKDGEYVIKVDEAKDYLQSKSDDYGSEIDDASSKLDDIKNVCKKYKYVISSTSILFGIAVIYIIRKSRH